MAGVAVVLGLGVAAAVVYAAGRDESSLNAAPAPQLKAAPVTAARDTGSSSGGAVLRRNRNEMKIRRRPDATTGSSRLDPAGYSRSF